MSKFEERIQNSLKEFDQATRSLLKRSGTIVELARSDSALGNIRRVVERFSGFLGDALKALEAGIGDDVLQAASRQVLEPIDHESIAVDCAQSMIRELRNPDRGPATDRVPRCGIQGHSRAVPIPELLSFFSSVRKSGTLQVSTPDENFTLVLVEGAVRQAKSDSSPPGGRLGDILVAQGSITEGELGKFINENQGPSRKLGEELVSHSLVVRENVARALHEQIRQLFFRMYTQDDATFAFYEGACPTEEYSVDMDVSGLLLASAVNRDHRESA